MSYFFKTLFPQFKKPIEIRIPKYKNKKFERFNQIRIIPRKKFYEIEILYNQPVRNSKLDKKIYMSIDLGLNNLATCVENRNIKYLEPIKKHKKYIGKRLNRGLFKGSNYLLNADVNGALNILRKVIGNDFIGNLSDKGCWFQPVRIRNLFQTSHEQFLLRSTVTI